MEAAVASGILKIVGNKLVPLLMKEYSSIVGAKKDLQELHGQVVEINSWLESVGDKAVGNDPSFSWLKQLKNIAYDVDDIVDEFQLKAEKHEATASGGIVSKYLCNKPKSIIFQCKAASKIKAIKKEFAGIVKQRKDFSIITNSLPAGHPVHHVNMTVGEMPLLPNIDAASVLGRDKDKGELISKLVEVKGQQTINIVSIVGLGGSGKTTLAKLVFNDGSIINKHFEIKLWVHVSQEFDVAKLVGKLFEAIAGEKCEQYPLQQMSKKISDELTGKRYLLVLDDVWTKNQFLWDQFMVHLKSGTPGSAILLTMRSSDVAGTVGSTYQFSLPFLSLADSWQLFQQSLGMHVKHLESEFVEVGKEIVNKCGGVPLAIKVIAGVLRGKELIGEWQAMRDSNLLDVEGEEASVSVSACLMLSYFHLPSHMKQCFTICSVLPKGYMIDKEHLIDQWIAHDMITPQAGVEFLDIGDKYFNSLVQMSFLQDVAEDWNGRVKCRMHDLVHDLALSILDDKISPAVPKEATSSAKGCRYFSLIERPENLAPKNIFRKARAVYMPWSGDYTNVMALKHAKHLRSVMVGYLDEEGANIISQVKYLKYLSMSLLQRCKTLPEGISDVWSLQALHVTHSNSLVEIPKSIVAFSLQCCQTQFASCRS
ncbi:putative disease resistance protein RGA3 [Sorghum bicolor]|uniref:putative disease resistance protein RGA3 n=1 Tax=Sorghum bicolor TaxID=4558 RepID=UPI000B425A15|nr:putative disease resistance protein RGA3 [Sorghum bicolor]|eukprot:XP_021316927.1 putative disease resistance protein RGA3 [Sorghum bicolor]